MLAIRYKTTANTAASASAVNKRTTEKLKNVAGTLTFQKLTCGSFSPVTGLTWKNSI